MIIISVHKELGYTFPTYSNVLVVRKGQPVFMQREIVTGSTRKKFPLRPQIRGQTI